MEVGNVVWFSSRQHPFVVQAIPCLDLDCPCSSARLILTEVRLQGPALAEPLSFELNVCLRHWQETAGSPAQRRRPDAVASGSDIPPAVA